MLLFFAHIDIDVIYSCLYKWICLSIYVLFPHAFHKRTDNSLICRKIYFLLWWITCAPKFFPTIQFHPDPLLLSNSVFKYRDNALSCFISFIGTFRPSFNSWSTFAVYYSYISDAFICGFISVDILFQRKI